MVNADSFILASDTLCQTIAPLASFSYITNIGIFGLEVLKTDRNFKTVFSFA